MQLVLYRLVILADRNKGGGRQTNAPYSPSSLMLKTKTKTKVKPNLTPQTLSSHWLLPSL